VAAAWWRRGRPGEHGAYRPCVIVGLVCALVAALAYGAGTVLQALPARRSALSTGLDPRLLLRLLRSAPYVAGLALDGAGFVLALVALRRLPVYVVQATVAGNLAVVAVLSWPVLGARVGRAGWAGVTAAVAGLVLVGFSAGAAGPAQLSTAGRYGLIATAAGLALAAAALVRRPGVSGPVLGALTGLLFGVVAVAARVAASPTDVPALVRDPAAWALAGAGAVALILYPSALQRDSVAATSATVVTAETLAPAIAAAAMFGDLPRAGWLPATAALTGLILVLAGTLALSRAPVPAG
jgi:drug/metabolite transporter (DMT)-like permease